MESPTQLNNPEIRALLDLILSRMQDVIGKRLVGLYLYGSLVTGDFDSETSDIDLLAATSSDIDQAEFDALKAMHKAITLDHRKWDGRLEIAYVSVHALKTFKTESSKIGIISPGEPFHIKEAGIDWLMNWYIVREKGSVLFGPPPTAIIEPASKAEFIQAVKDSVRWWREHINAMRDRPGQAYAILTMCRALYTYKSGEQASKIRAAAWAENELPQWSSLIKNALTWRKGFREQSVDHDATLPETRRFVHFVIDLILA